MSSATDRKTLSRSGYDFIDESRLHSLLDIRVEPSRLDEVVAKSLSKQALTLDETAVLLAADRPEMVERIFDAARRLKKDVYGKPHRPFRSAVRRQRVYERLPVLCLSPF